MQTTYSTSRNPFRLYAIGFGPVFASGSANASWRLVHLANHAILRRHPEQCFHGIAVQSDYNRNGHANAANMTSAYTAILQNGVQIALIK